jgi:hypothetical protein
MSQVFDPSGAYGYTDLETQIWSRKVPLLAGGTVTAKSVCAMGTAGAVTVAATDGTASLCVGIAAAAITSGSVGLVIVQGMAEDVPVNGAVAAGDVLKRSATTAGRVAATATPATGEALGVAINASASNVCDVWVSKGA